MNDRETQILINRTQAAMQMLSDSVDVDPKRRGGVPVLKNTRFPISQVLAQISGGDSVEDLVSNLELDGDTVRSFLDGLSIILDRSLLDPSENEAVQ